MMDYYESESVDEPELPDDPNVASTSSSSTRASNVGAPSSRRNPSIVWNYFSKSCLQDECVCLVCKRNIKTPSVSTTKLHSHIKSHPATYIQYNKELEKVQQRHLPMASSKVSAKPTLHRP